MTDGKERARRIVDNLVEQMLVPLRGVRLDPISADEISLRVQTDIKNRIFVPPPPKPKPQPKAKPVSTGPRQVLQQWEVQSRNDPKAKPYKVTSYSDGTWACSCPRWKFHTAPKVDCKHISGVKNDEPIDAVQTPAVPPGFDKVPVMSAAAYFVKQTKRIIMLKVMEKKNYTVELTSREMRMLLAILFDAMVFWDGKIEATPGSHFIKDQRKDWNSLTVKIDSLYGTVPDADRRT